MMSRLIFAWLLNLCPRGHLRCTARAQSGCGLLVLVLLGFGLLTRSAAGASAERERSTPVPDAPRVESQRDGARRIHLALHGDALDAVALQQALTQELGREFMLTPTGDPVTEDTLTVAYAAARSELVVSWQNDGQTITRVIATSAARVVEDSVLLASNLMHAQLDDLAPSELQEQPVALALPAPQEPVVAIPTSRAPAQVPVVHAQAIAEPRRLARTATNSSFGWRGARLARTPRRDSNVWSVWRSSWRSCLVCARSQGLSRCYFWTTFRASSTPSAPRRYSSSCEPARVKSLSPRRDRNYLKRCP